MSILNSLASTHQSPPIPTLLNPLVPQKIGIHIWRISLNKLPVRTELDKRGIDLHSTRCPVCDDDIETLQHTFLYCKSSLDIWNRIFKWWKLDHQCITCLSDLSKCPNPMLNSNLGLSIWQAVVWVTCYFIWQNRNNHVFGKDTLGSSKIVADIQAKCFEWINARWKKGNLDWLNWISNPRMFDANPPKDGIG
ncbi:uncharacterized protein [Rutidosis leptorrhynchoides]|uniref:uncharacterized protein n=1 Tax=Rutidosis leptorrhynchoides TaxID=125765 RepID=UPI003A98D247